MEIHAVIQISKIDKQWDFDPEWVVKHNHLKDLINQLKNIEREIDIHVLTTDQDKDLGIEEYLKDLPVSIKKVTPDNYCSTALNTHLNTFSEEDLIIFPSAYQAYLLEDVLKVAIQKMRNLDVNFVRFAPLLRQSMPIIAKNKALTNTLEDAKDNYKNAEAFDCNYRQDWMVKPGLPSWIFPGRLVIPLIRSYNDSNFCLDGTLLSEENVHINQQNIQEIRFYIDSNFKAKFWRQLKVSTEPQIDTFYDKYQKLLPTNSESPRAIIADLNSDETIYSSAPPQQNDSLSTKKIGQIINKAGQSSAFYQTYLQLGNYYDPLCNSDFEKLLDSIDKKHFRIGLHIGSSKLNLDKARAIVEQVEEVFFHFDAPESIQKKKYLANSKQANKYYLLWQEKLKQFKKSEVNGHVLPTISAVFHSDQLRESQDYLDLRKVWTTAQERRNELQKMNKFDASASDWEEFITNFYGSEGCADHIIFQRVPSKFAKDQSTFSQFKPMERKPCRRIMESIYLSPDGSIYPCDQVAGEERYSLDSSAEKDVVSKGWTNQQRLDCVKDHQNENFDAMEPCVDCNFWYQPLL